MKTSEQETTKDKIQRETALKRFSAFVSTARSMLVNALLLLLVVAVAAALAWELSRDTIIVDPFGVPQELAERGYTGEIVTQRLIDELFKIRVEATTRKNDIDPDIVPDWSQPDIDIPGAPMSLRTIVRYVKESFSTQGLHISGEITRDGDVYSLRLRERSSNVFQDEKVSSAKELDKLLHLGARELMKIIDPYKLASYLKDKDSAQSLRVLAYCLANEPEDDDPWAYNLLGLISLDEEKYATALQHFSQAIEVKDDFFLAYSNSGIALAHLEEFSKAKEKHEAAKRIAPDDPYVYTSWGESLNLEGRHKQAIQKFEMAVSLDSKNAFAYNEWGRTLRQTGDNKAAIDKFRVVVKLLPESKVANNNLGNELRYTRRYPEAEKYLNYALKLDSEYGSAYYNLGLLFYEQAEYARALSCYDRALTTKLVPSDKKTIQNERKTLIDTYFSDSDLFPKENCI